MKKEKKKTALKAFLDINLLHFSLDCLLEEFISSDAGLPNQEEASKLPD